MINNPIYLVRQCLKDGAKALILLDFLDGNVEFTPYLYLWKIGSVEIVKTWDKSCVFLLY